MRKKRKNTRFFPYWAGIAAGYIVTAAMAASGALIMWIFGTDGGLAWLAAVPAIAAGSFVCGRTAGKIRRSGGLKIGLFCGIIYILPMLAVGLVLGTVGSGMLPVKLALCAGFGTAGGVSGVNSPEGQR